MVDQQRPAPIPTKRVTIAQQARGCALALGCVLLVLLAAGCGSGAVVPTSSLAGPDPTAGTSETPPGTDQPTVESAAWFGAEVLGRLEQEAFWADDDAFLATVAAPDAFDLVAGALSARVDEVRWAIATFPGETKRTWFASAPLTVEVTDVDATARTAEVAVWVVSVFSREDLGPPETRFTIERAELIWDDASSGWRIRSLTVTPGPSVSLAGGQVPVTAGELDSALAGHLLIRAEGTDHRKDGP